MADRELLTLSLYSLLASNRSGLFLVYLPVFLVVERGAPVAAALAIVSVAYVASSLTGPLAGRWSDRIGRRRPFLLAAEAGSLPIFLAIPLLPTYVDCGVAFILAQTVLALGAPSLNAYVADLTRTSERGRGYGLLNATGFAGQVAGFAIIALLVGPFGIGVLFPFVVAVMVSSLAVIVLAVPDRAAAPPADRLGWREARPVLGFSVAVSIRALGIGAVGTFFGVYATQLGASDTDVALIAIVGLSAAALSAIPFGRLIDRIGGLRGVWYGTVVTLIGIIVFLLAPTWTYLVPAQAVRLVGVSLLSPAMLVWVANLAPAGHRAEFMGLFSVINSTLWSLGPLAGALTLEAAGVPGLFAFAIGTTVVSLVALEVMYLTRYRGPAAGGPGRPGVVPGPTPALDNFRAP